MSKLKNIIIGSVKSCLVLNLIINLELVMSNDDEIYNTLRANELLKYVPMSNLYYKINSINKKHFDVTEKQRGGKRLKKMVSRFLRNNPDDDQFELLINTENSTEDLNQKNMESNYHINKEKANLKDRPNYESTIEDISQENDQLDNIYEERENFEESQVIDDSRSDNSDSYLEDDRRLDGAYIGTNFNNYNLLEEPNIDTNELDDSSDYIDDLKSLHQTCSDDDCIEQENDDAPKIFVINPEDVQKLLNKDTARTVTKDTVNKRKPIFFEPLIQFKEPIHYEDNDKYEFRHESYKNQYGERSKSKPKRIDVENKERSDKINSMYQKAEVKLKDINWLDILNKTIPVETDSESSEALTYGENIKKSSEILESLKQDVTNTDVLDKIKFLDTIPTISKESAYKNQDITNKVDVLDKLKFLDTIPTMSKDPDDKNSLLLLNDINHLLHNTPVSRKAQKDSFPKIMDILKDAYLLTVKVKNFVKEIHSLKKYVNGDIGNNNKEETIGNKEEKSEELFKYYEFDPPRVLRDITVEELAALLIQDIHVYMKRIYSPSARHEIIKKLGVINNKVKSVKKDLMDSLQQSINKRKEMSEKLKHNKRLKEHFRKNWSDSINDLFGDAKYTNSHRKQNEEGVPQEVTPLEGAPQEGTQLEGASQEGTPLEGAPQGKAAETKPTEEQIEKIEVNETPKANEKSKDPENQDPQNIEPQNQEPQNQDPQHQELQNQYQQNQDQQNQDPQNQDPQNQEPQNQDQQNQDPQHQEPQNQDQQNQDPQNQDPKHQDPQNQDPQHQEPQNQDQQNQDPQNQDPQNQDQQNQDPQNQDPQNQDQQNQDPQNQDPQHQEITKSQENENENTKLNKEDVPPIENKPIDEYQSETKKKDSPSSEEKESDKKDDVEEEITTEEGKTKGSTKKYRLPVYGLFDYWTYKKTVVEDECPEGTVKLKNECIRLPPH